MTSHRRVVNLIQGIRQIYRLRAGHVSDLPRLAGASFFLRFLRLVYEPPCSTRYKICSSKWCSTVLPRLYFLDSVTKGTLSVCIFLVIISSIGETNARFVPLTVPALCYALGLSILVCVKSLFNSWKYIRSNEFLLVLGNGVICVWLLLRALEFDDHPTEDDRVIKFTRRFTLWLCTYELILIVESIICAVIKWNHKWHRHLPDESLRERRIKKLHRTFKDVRKARYGGLTAVPNLENSHDFGDGCIYFPGEKALSGRPLRCSRPLVRANEALLSPEFLRCSCCIDDSSLSYPASSPQNEETNDDFPVHLRYRSDIRSEFLARPVWQHLSPLYSEDIPSTFKPHSLCNLCLWISCTSNIIQSRESHNPLRHFGLYIRERESFEHYASSQELFESVQNGCHLCTLIWTSMSPAQSTALLVADTTLQAQQEQALSTARDDKAIKAIRKDYHARRRLRLVVESFNSHVPPVDSQVKLAHSLGPGRGAAQIVPHFGGYKRPRRWMHAIRDFERHLLLEPGESAFAPPILVLPRQTAHTVGPLHMPISDSTGSPYSVSLIKHWLQDTETEQEADFLPGRVIHVGAALEYGIVRVIDRDEIVARSIAIREYGIESLSEDECAHRFPLGCLNPAGQQCCACLANARDSGRRGEENHMRENSYCPRCKEYWADGIKAYGVPPIDIPDGPRNLQYVALSHCWGKNPDFLRLTLDNQHNLRAGIPISKLTKTFQESVETAASVGYSFLWIDSLCIIQDSPDDWKRESITMRDVYRNASFAIVAAASWSGKEGLFRSQDALSNHPCVLGVRNHEGDDHEKRAKVTYAIPSQMDIEKTRRTELELCLWNRRGWCLQERALSRRVVFFGESQLHFELKDSSSSSGGGDVSNTHLESQMNERAYFELNHLRPESSVARGYFSDTWWEYVNSYTQRSLTYRSDRPLAVRGLAALMEGEAGIPMFLPSLRARLPVSEVVANDFIASLLWYVDKGTTTRPAADDDHDYPSWSWLSVDGVVLNESAGEVNSNSTLTILELVESSSSPSHDDNNNSSGNESENENENENDAMLAVAVTGLKLRCCGKLRKAHYCISANSDPDSQLYYFARRSGVDALCFSPPGYRDSELLTARQLQAHNRRKAQWRPRSEGKFEYLEMVKPISNDSEMGPRAYSLFDGEGVSIGWFVPDTTDALQTMRQREGEGQREREVCCLQIRLEPVTRVDKYKLINTWTVRGLVLVRVDGDDDGSSSETPQRRRTHGQGQGQGQGQGGLPVYARIGYFELDQTHNGFLHPDLAFDWEFPPEERKELRRNFLRHWPDVDPHGFFEDVPEQEFLIA